MHDDPEALVDRRLLRDPEDARELVLQRAEAVGLDVRGGQHQPVAAARDERLERLLVVAADRAGAPVRVRLLVAQVLVEGRGHEQLALLGRRRLQQDLVDLRQRLGDGLALLGPLDQRRDLQQLEEADVGRRDVHVGVEPHLAEPSRDARDRVEHLVAHHPERRVQALGRARTAAPRGTPRSRRPRRAPPRRTATGRAPCASSAQESTTLLRARVIATCSSLRMSASWTSRAVVRQRLAQERVRHAVAAAARRAGKRGRVEACHERVRDLHVARGVHRDDRDRARQTGGDDLVLRQAGLGHGRQVAREIARRALRVAANVRARQVDELRDVGQPLGGVRLRGEELLAANADPLDQPVHERVGLHRLERPRRAPVEAQERERTVASLLRELRALARGGDTRRSCRACAGA